MGSAMIFKATVDRQMDRAGAEWENGGRAGVQVMVVAALQLRQVLMELEVG